MTLAQTLNEINESFKKFSKESETTLRSLRFLESKLAILEEIKKRLTDIEKHTKKESK